MEPLIQKLIQKTPTTPEGLREHLHLCMEVCKEIARKREGAKDEREEAHKMLISFLDMLKDKIKQVHPLSDEEVEKALEMLPPEQREMVKQKQAELRKLTDRFTAQEM